MLNLRRQSSCSHTSRASSDRKCGEANDFADTSPKNQRPFGAADLRKRSSRFNLTACNCFTFGFYCYLLGHEGLVVGWKERRRRREGGRGGDDFDLTFSFFFSGSFEAQKRHFAAFV